MRTLLKPILAAMLCTLLAVGAAYATITPLPIVTPKGPYITGQPGSGTLGFVFTACDNSNGNSFAITGTELLLVQNTDASNPHTITITSVADNFGRTGDITAYNLPLSTYAAFNFRQGVGGFAQTDGTVHLTCSSNTISFAVLRTAN